MVRLPTAVSSEHRSNKLLSERFPSILSIPLYLLLNWCYTTAVFTDPGSTLTSISFGYSHLPSHEPPPHQELPSFTVKSSGETRFCKKCNTKKPDRTHHCSTCRRCVLKMDHHCPWLATCVGLRNYKAFLLFLIYTCMFCWVCFLQTSIWLWSEVLSDGQYTESFMPINYVLLCCISGIIGLVLTGFTGWHISLAWRGQTTIECLEKTRYLSPLRKTMQRQFKSRNGGPEQSFSQQLTEIHANALPGVTRPEEGEEPDHSNYDIEEGITARSSLRRTYDQMEQDRERERYEDYLDEVDSDKLPNAFDLGWKRNLKHLFGEKPLFWLVPVCNTTGDGWRWQPNPKWLVAREELQRERERTRPHWQPSTSEGQLDRAYDRQQYHGNPNEMWSQDRQFGHTESHSDTSLDSRVSLRTFRRKESFDEHSEDYDDNYQSSDEEQLPLQRKPNSHAQGQKND